jgi:hypothetical protein
VTPRSLTTFGWCSCLRRELPAASTNYYYYYLTASNAASVVRHDAGFALEALQEHIRVFLFRVVLRLNEAFHRHEFSFVLRLVDRSRG